MLYRFVPFKTMCTVVASSRIILQVFLVSNLITWNDSCSTLGYTASIVGDFKVFLELGGNLMRLWIGSAKLLT